MSEAAGGAGASAGWPIAWNCSCCRSRPWSAALLDVSALAAGVIAFQILRLLVAGGRGLRPGDAQNLLNRLPARRLARASACASSPARSTGARLEIAYHRSGGAHQVWLANSARRSRSCWPPSCCWPSPSGCSAAEFAPIPTLYGALQSSTFFLVLAMALSTLFKSEAAGALVTAWASPRPGCCNPGTTASRPFFLEPAEPHRRRPVERLAWTGAEPHRLRPAHVPRWSCWPSAAPRTARSCSAARSLARGWPPARSSGATVERCPADKGERLAGIGSPLMR